jgi:hypothetical protein
MATARKPPEPTVSAEAPTSQTPATPDTVTVQTLLEQVQRALLDVITNAVSADTNHGVDIVLARQAAEVHRILFGESR